MKHEENQKLIDEMWDEYLSGRDMPTETETAKQVLEELYGGFESEEKTYFQMYKEISLLYKGTEVDFDAINKVFDLEKRTEIDLRNLKEFIVCVTLMCGQGVFKAKITNNKSRENMEIDKQKKRFDLMTILMQAIDSVIVTL